MTIFGGDNVAAGVGVHGIYRPALPELNFDLLRRYSGT